MDQETPILFPAPYDPSTRRSPESRPLPPPELVVKFPPSPDPFTESILKDKLRNTGVLASRVFPWPRTGPLSIIVVNTHNQTITVEVYVAHAPDNSKLTDQPAIAFEVGPGGRKVETLNPEGDDDWGPFVFAAVSAKVAPSNGDVDISFSRPG